MARINLFPVVKNTVQDVPGDPVDKNPPDNAGNMDLIPGPRRFHKLQGN